MQDGGESTTADAHSRVWKAIRNLNVIGAVGIFLWNACSNLLPTKENVFFFKKRLLMIRCAQFVGWMWRLHVISYVAAHLQMMSKNS